MSLPQRSHRPWQILLFLTVVWLAYFIVQYDKPVHIDDTHYLYAARHLLEEPWCPLCYEINWQKSPVPAYSDLINPPFYMYLQAGWIALFGDSVRGLHVLSTLMAVLAAACGVLVARRFTRHAMLASALVLFSPNVLPVANLMVDVPSLAMGLASVAVFISAVDRDHKGQAALGGLLVGLALLTKYNAVVLLPLLALYALLRGRARYIFFLAIPVGLMSLWCLYNLIIYGQIHLAITASYSPYERTPQRWWENIYSAMLVPGSTFVFLGVLASARVRLRGFSIWGPLGALVLLGPTQMWWWQPTFPAAVYWTFAINTIILVAFATAAPSGASETPETSRRQAGLPENLDLSPSTTVPAAAEWRRDDLFLWLWIGCVVLFQVLFAYHQAPRYHILAFLPLALLLVRTLEAAEPRWRLRQYVLAWGSVAVQLLVALFVAAADDAHARANSDYPAYVEQQYGSDDGRIFCIGHWGLQFYCEERGFITFDAIHGDVREKDLVIVPSNNYLANFPKAFQPLPEGRPVCDDQGPFFELVQDVAYPQDRTVAPLSPTEGFFGTWLLGRLHRAWPFSVSPLHSSSLYASRMPSLPYSWLSREAVPDERFLLLRARCDYTIATEKIAIDFASWADRMYMVAGWGAPLASDYGLGVWSSGPFSRLEVVLDHRGRDYLLRVDALAVRYLDDHPVRVDVWLNRRWLGELEFTSERSTLELLLPAEALAAGEDEIVFGYKTVHPIGYKSIFFLGIELFPHGEKFSGSIRHTPTDFEAPSADSARGVGGAGGDGS